MTEDERRGLERRVFELERQVGQLMTLTAVTQVEVHGLVETIKSRFVAFDRGIDLILARFDPLTERMDELEMVRDQAVGAILLMRVLVATGLIAGVVALVKWFRGV